MQEDKIAQYKKLIKDKGIDEALKLMQNSAELSDEDFTESHKTDTIFSDEETELISQKTQQVPTEIQLDFANNQNLVWEEETEDFSLSDKNSEQIVMSVVSNMKLSKSSTTILIS